MSADVISMAYESLLDAMAAQPAERFTRLVVYMHIHGQRRLLHELLERRARIDYPRIEDLDVEL